MAFSKHGVGFTLAGSFDKALLEAPQAFPSCKRGRTVLIAVDLGGSHSRQLFETYSFLVLDLDMNNEWLAMQAAFRSDVMVSMRRMSFKTLNDKVRRRGITPFLQMGNSLSGWLVTFGISKNRESVFEKDDPIAPEFERILESWKPAVRERLMRVLHLSAFLMSGLCLHRQNVLWVIDEDEIASNVDQLTHLTRLLGQVYSNACETQLGHLRCATAKGDDGTRSLEDFIAYCDLAAGAVCEVATAMAGSHQRLQRTIVTPLPPLLSWKSRYICSWLAYDQSPLRRFTCLIDLKKNAPGMKVQMIRWHAMPGNLLVPPDHDPARAS
jgi:hypothetical protein